MILVAGGVAFPSLPFEDLYHLAIWGSVLGSLIIAEWFIVGRTLRPLDPKQHQS